MGVYCIYLWFTQTIQISHNITTNEKINWKHYRYLQDEVGIAYFLFHLITYLCLLLG